MVPEQVELTLLGDRLSRVLLVLWSSQNLWRGRCWVNILRSRDRRLKKAGSLSPTPGCFGEQAEEVCQAREAVWGKEASLL